MVTEVVAVVEAWVSGLFFFFFLVDGGIRTWV